VTNREFDWVYERRSELEKSIELSRNPEVLKEHLEAIEIKKLKLAKLNLPP